MKCIVGIKAELFLLGKMVHTMVAHLEAVTCLAVDPNGLFLLSGSM